MVNSSSTSSPYLGPCPKSLHFLRTAPHHASLRQSVLLKPGRNLLKDGFFGKYLGHETIVVCIYACIHMYMCTYVYTHNLHTCVLFIYIACAYKYIYIHTRVYIHIYIHVYIHVCMCMYTYTPSWKELDIHKFEFELTTLDT